MISRKSLRIYAALASLKEGPDDDPMDALIPFMLPILKPLEGKIFRPSHLKAGANLLYNLNLDLEVANVFAEKLTAKGYLEVRAREGQAAIVLVKPIEERDMEDERGEKLSVIFERLISKFRSFCSGLSTSIPVVRNDLELESLLINFLVSLDAYSDEELAKRIREDEHEENGDNPFLDEVVGDQALRNEDRYLTASFVRHLLNSTDRDKEVLYRIAKAGLLKSLVEDFIKPHNVARESSTTLILDTTVAMKFIGVSGKEQQDDTTRVFERLVSLGCKLIVLPITCDEISNNLKALLARIPNERFGLTADALRRREISIEFVQSVMEKPEHAISEHGIVIRQINLENEPSLVKWFPEDSFKEFLDGVYWRNESYDARFHDAAAMTLCCRLRKSEKKIDPLECNYVFVTGTPAFSKYARKFSIDHQLIGERHVPAVVHQRDIAAIAWLRVGSILSDSEDIPNGILLARCEAVLTSRRDFIEKANSIIGSATEDRQSEFRVLLSEPRSLRRLQDEVHGRVDYLTEETAYLCILWWH